MAVHLKLTILSLFCHFTLWPPTTPLCSHVPSPVRIEHVHIHIHTQTHTHRDICMQEEFARSLKAHLAVPEYLPASQSVS